MLPAKDILKFTSIWKRSVEHNFNCMSIGEVVKYVNCMVVVLMINYALFAYLAMHNWAIIRKDLLNIILFRFKLLP